MLSEIASNDARVTDLSASAFLQGEADYFQYRFIDALGLQVANCHLR